MKSTLLLIAAICCFTVFSKATVHTVTVGDHEFMPAKGLTVHAGDTIKWLWISGAHHIMTTKTPHGAVALSGKVNGRMPELIYVPTISGTYEYQCKYYAPMGMTGSFTVVGGNEEVSMGAAPGVNSSVTLKTRKGREAFTTYPNPTAGKLHIEIHNTNLPVTLIVTDMDGKEVKRVDHQSISETDLDLSNLPNGNYVLHAEQGDRIYKQELVVAH